MVEVIEREGSNVGSLCARLCGFIVETGLNWPWALRFSAGPGGRERTEGRMSLSNVTGRADGWR